METQNKLGWKGWLVQSLWLLPLGLLGYGYLENRRVAKLDELATKAAMTHYQPVGNGGALAAWYEKMSPERREMYNRMQRAYEKVAGKDNLNTSEYNTLKFYAEGREH